MTTPRKSLTPAQAVKRLRKLKIQLKDLAAFKTNLLNVIDHSNLDEHESYHVHLVRDFLNDTFYKDKYFINTKDNKDLVIHSDKDKTSPVSVIIETKRPSNLSGMPTTGNLNAKAFQELVLYYLDERIHHKNEHITQLVITNSLEWFIFDAHEFDKYFFKNTQLKKDHKDYDQQRMSGKGTDYFYKHIAAPVIEQIKDDIEFTWFDIRTFEKELRNNDPDMNKKLAPLYKVFSPEHLLKLQVANDSNSLDRRFYEELLHIIGLKEIKQGSKKLIDRFPENERQDGSLIENTILHLEEIGKVGKDQNFNIALELCITWVNRILFLKLLESQLISYHKGDESYRILNIKTIHNYDDLNKLFFQVLAKKREERNPRISEIFEKIPYLNSSLFVTTDIEKDMILISNLEDDIPFPLYKKSVLKEKKGSSLNTIDYLFKFLDAYDFSSEGKEEIQEEHKTLINASVLGLIFEKINGYKDGSYFTPGFITEYMCRETLRRAVVQKFNEAKGWNCKDLTAVYNKGLDIEEANDIVNSLKICDPAVGSGHFLVSALNEILAIKHFLGILCDSKGKRLFDYQVEVQNDDLLITNIHSGELFEYDPNNSQSRDIQQGLFHEKQTIIENCLFGVDINPNSVKICRLRLWIELLKNAYYKGENELETLPNIDINIKCGNSLISRFDIHTDLEIELRKNSKIDIKKYQIAVEGYKNAKSKSFKEDMEKQIKEIKSNFSEEVSQLNPQMIYLNRLRTQLLKLTGPINLFQMNQQQKNRFNKNVTELTKKIRKAEDEIKEIENSIIYENAFEWRFEFPEVLDNDGNFVGFDVVIGNPPWGADLSQKQKEHLKQYYQLIDSSTPNSYAYFLGLSYKICDRYITQILPDSILVKDFSKTRTLFKDILYQIYWYQNTAIPHEHRPFLDVEHDVCALFINKNTTSKNCKNITRFYKNKSVIINTWNFNKDHFIIEKYENSYNLLINRKNNSLLKKILTLKELSEILQCHEGIHSGNMRNKLFVNDNISNSFKPMFLGAKNGDLINNYYSQRTGNWFVNYDSSIIDKTAGEYASLRDEKIFIYPKIYITRTGNPLKAFLDENNYASNNFFSVQFKDYKENNTENLIPILCLLNSKFANYLIRTFIAPSLGETFTETKIFHLLKLPFVSNLKNNKRLNSYYNEILLAYSNINSPDITEVQIKIDKIIYELYGLTEEEIRVVEGDA